MQCQMCDDGKDIVSKCVDCDSTMCFECSTYHSKHKIFKTHVTEKIESTTTETSEKSILDEEVCDLHKREITLFCESCNGAICDECATQNHKSHKFCRITFQAQKRRDFLRLGIGALKSKITEIDGTIEMSKDDENSYNKFCTEGKEEIQVHAKRSKEIVCDIIDVLAKLNIQRIDEIQKKDIKSITNFQDELVTKKLSLQYILKSTEDAVNLSRDGKLFNKYTFLYQTLRNNVLHSCDSPEVFAPQFCSGNPIEHTYVAKCFGLVQKRNTPIKSRTSEFHIYSLPLICEAKEMTKIYSFTLNNPRSLIGFYDNQTWIQLPNTIHLYSSNGSVIKKQNAITEDEQVLLATKDEFWIKAKELIKKIKIGNRNEAEDIMRFPAFESCTCNILKNNCVVAYSFRNKCFYEIKLDGHISPIKKEISMKITPVEEKLADLIPIRPVKIIETASNYIMLTSKDKVITLDRNFKICNVYAEKNSNFRGICDDAYGNVFVTDYSLGRICLFTSYGDFARTVLTKDVSYPTDITRDHVGNLWFLDCTNRVQIYSYI
ncbi:tripartite motif-containing protein 37 [Mytilus galloprovincialis]|uniref:Tripartite motif-containing protein 37 n=2 Tax=Mytilus galloprovincialis TaxID=29158 RepID=A0A8B6G8M9_MYTGA|nr:tripartite motif-containing protein 37 [Mytilus galloprovincialis]